MKERERKIHKKRIVFPAPSKTYSNHIKQNITLLMCNTFTHSVDFVWLLVSKTNSGDLENRFFFTLLLLLQTIPTHTVRAVCTRVRSQKKKCNVTRGKLSHTALSSFQCELLVFFLSSLGLTSHFSCSVWLLTLNSDYGTHWWTR